MMRLRNKSVLTMLMVLAACPGGGLGDDTGATESTGGPTTEATGSGTTDEPTSGGMTGSGGDWTPAACFDAWDQVATVFPDAGALVACTEVAGGEAVMRSLLVLDKLTIDNNGQAMNPCVEARCDADYAYVGTNALPHYDFVPTTPNALVENITIFRVPLAPQPVTSAQTEDGAAIDGCVDAYAQHLSNPGQATAAEPSGFCRATMNDGAYVSDALAAGGTSTTYKLQCLGTTGFMINGSPIYGPNEAGIPDPYGSPLFFMPNTAGEPYLPDPFGTGAALDLCGGHTANSMHYHGVNEACFEQAGDGTPALSYAEAAQAWDMQAMLEGPCTEESGVVGWSLDGYPIMGPCVCTARGEGGACTEVKRARSSWLYAGLGSWGADPQEATALAVEGDPCAVDGDCCQGNNCDYRCSYVPVESGQGTAIESRCTLVDYTWCTHRWVDRSATPGDGFVYMDRCNGFEGPDGYAYHATASFPYITGCFRGAPQETAMMGGGMMDPPKCMPGQTMMCCGDGVCGGPETAQNCPEDC